MRLLILSLPAAAGWGGSEELWADTARAARADGHRVWITPRDDDSGNDARLRDLEARGVTLVRRTPGSAETVPAAVRDLIGSMDSVLISAGGSVRELVHPRVLDLLLGFTGRLVVTVQLVDERDMLTDTERADARALLRDAVVVLPAHRSLRVLERAIAMRVPAPVITPSPIRADLTGRLPWPQAATARLACVGRLNPEQKGQDALLEALADPVWRERDWRLTFVGRGLGRTHLEELVDHYGLTGHVGFTGFVDRMTDVWETHELLVLPSREESMPIAIMEAMYCGRPCLVTDVGDNARLVRDQETGFVARSERPADLAPALERAWRSRPDWPELGRRAHQRYVATRDPRPGRSVLELLSGAPAGSRS
jgi:glycosyltransferase involved in cell wall biosynthesis